jgi:protein TonB
MEVSKILGSDILDIIFDGRNKAYGAYELRKKYAKRMAMALLITASLALGLLLISFISDKLSGNKKASVVQVKEVELADLKQEEKNEPPPPPPPKPPPPPPQIEMAKFTPPKVVKDEDVKPEEEMKEVEQLKDTKIGIINQEGTKDEGVTAPPVEDKGGVVEAPKEDENKVFQKVEIDAQFPGGENAWNKYIKREIERYIDELQDAGQNGTCIVQFIVDKEGNISDVEALTMKGTKLAEICINAIKKGPKWTAAEQNGRRVKAYRKQPVTFQIEEQ